MEKITPSAPYRSTSLPLHRISKSARFWSGALVKTMSLMAKGNPWQPFPKSRAWMAYRRSRVKSPLLRRSRYFSSSSASIWARKPSRPRLTPTTGRSARAAQQALWIIVPSPPMERSRSHPAAAASAPSPPSSTGPMPAAAMAAASAEEATAASPSSAIRRQSSRSSSQVRGFVKLGISSIRNPVISRRRPFCPGRRGTGPPPGPPPPGPPRSPPRPFAAAAGTRCSPPAPLPGSR